MVGKWTACAVLAVFAMYAMSEEAEEAPAFKGRIDWSLDSAWDWNGETPQLRW